jgi:hypothetical protein
MSPDPFTLAHSGLGTITLVLFWATYLQVKGSPRHRSLGRLFIWSWVPVLASVFGVSVLAADRFSPPELVQFIYLSTCVAVVVATAWLSLRWKRDLARFRGRWFKAGGVTLVAMALAVLAAGIAGGEVMPIVFSSVGLIYGTAMVRFAWRSGPIHPNWPLMWHLNGMMYLVNALHGTLLAVAWRHLVDPTVGDLANIVAHFGTLALCLALRLYWGARRNAPMRFGPTGRAEFA